MKPLNRSWRLAAVFALVASVPAPPAAWGKEQTASSENDFVAQLRRCQSEADNTTRLACFDRAAAAMLAATDDGDLRVVDRQEVRETKRKLFGFSLPDFGIFGGSKKDRDPARAAAEEIKQVDTTIARVQRGAAGSYLLTTADGAVWEVYDAPARLMTPRVGDKLEIRKGAFSAYFMRIGGQPAVKGRRVS